MSQSSTEELENSTMTSEERKSKYRDLLEQVETLQSNDESSYKKTDILDEIIENANVLFKDSNIKERIKHTDEVLLDAKVVATATNVLLHITESIDCALDTYDHIDFARKITTQLLNFDINDYSKLTQIANSIIKQPPNFSFLYGELGQINVEEKPEKVRKPKQQKEKREEQAIKKVPEKVTDIGKQEDSVDDTVRFLQWVLNEECESGKEHLNYFDFLIDPDSYSATIENMFHFSFIVRDGRAKIYVDDEGVLRIIPLLPQDTAKAKKNGVIYKQSIFSINMDTWQELVQTFNIKRCYLSKWKGKWQAIKK